MKSIVKAAVAILAMCTATAVLAKEPSAQQQRMKSCNADAKGMKGDERKQFMSSCLKGESAAAPQQTQQNKMKTCNAEAGEKGLKGDERKKFMSSCLKG